MQIPLGIVFNGIDIFILVFVRMAGLFVIAPIFGRQNIPVYYKIGFSLLLSLLLVNTLKIKPIDYGENFYQFGFLILKETLVGILTGYISYLIFTGIYIAGQLIDMQVGFGMVSVLDPVSNIQVPITSNVYFMLTMLIFLSANGHHVLITALFESYKMVPINEATFNASMMDDILRIFGEIFIIGFKVAAPVIAAILITDIALGVISKSVPQLNVFVIGMPLKIILGVAVMWITIPIFISLVSALKDGVNSEMFNFIKDMGLNR